MCDRTTTPTLGHGAPASRAPRRRGNTAHIPPAAAAARPRARPGGGDNSVAKKIAAVVGNGDVNTTPPDMAAAADVKREREFLVQLLESARGALCCFVRVPP